VFVSAGLWLAGCANIQFPTQSEIDPTTPAAFKSFPAYKIESTDEARAYVADAKFKLREAQRQEGFIEAAGDAGVAAAGITGVLGGALNWGNHLILRSVIYGGSAYEVGQAIAPRPQENTLQSGIAVLDCIGRTAEPAYPWADLANSVLAPVSDDLNTLQQAVDNANTDGFTANNDLTVKSAVDDIASAQAYLDSHQPMIFAQVLSAVNLVIDATNQLLLNETADPSAFSTLIKSISATPASSAPAQAGNGAGQGVKTPQVMVSAQKTPKEIADDAITSAKAALDDAVSAASSKLGAGSVNRASASFDACIPGAAVITLDPPATSITLAANKSYEVTVVSGMPEVSWAGQVPDAKMLTYTKAQQTIELNATAALDQSYQLLISVAPTQITLLDTPTTITLTISPAAPASSPPGQKPPAPQPKPVQDKPAPPKPAPPAPPEPAPPVVPKPAPGAAPIVPAAPLKPTPTPTPSPAAGPASK
jgi:hypothetical protein